MGIWSSEIVLLVIATFTIAGLVKGVIGMGLPTVSLAILTAFQGLGEAMVLMLVPSLVTNVWQAFDGGALRDVLKRFWAFLLGGALFTWLAAGLIKETDAAVLSGLLGISVVAYAGYGLLALKLLIPGVRKKWLLGLMGSLSGLLTGLTGSFAMPAVPYFQSLGMSRDFLIQVMGVWFTIATLVLGLALQSHNLLPPDLGILSAVGVVPAAIGMVLGQKIRKYLSEQIFRRVMLWALMTLGIYLTWGGMSNYLA